FPPKAPSETQIRDIVAGFVEDSSFSNVQEAGCAVWGCLTKVNNMKKLSEVNVNLAPLF
ncbi:hypothetical protein BC835DRAFT_1226409, partial [Cytidiella melzeri]